MLNGVLNFSRLETQLSENMTAESSKRVKLHIQFFKRILMRYEVLHGYCHRLVKDINSLIDRDYWLKLEVKSAYLQPKDDVLFRRCLFHFASTISEVKSRPSSVFVFDTNIDLLNWYRKNFELGSDLHEALTNWNLDSGLAGSTTRFYAQKALMCLHLLFDKAPKLADLISKHGLSWFRSSQHFKNVFHEHPIEDRNKVLQSALLSVLRVNYPKRFSTVKIAINRKSIDVTDLAQSEPVLIKQLQAVADSEKFKGDLEHSIEAMTRRFLAIVTSIRRFSEEKPDAFKEHGLDNFKANNFSLLKEAKAALRKDQFSELLLVVEQHLGEKIHRHDYIAHLLPFYFKRYESFRCIDYSEVALTCPSLMLEIEQLHRSEIALLPEKNYNIETLHSRFSKLKRLIVNYLIPNYKKEVLEHGFLCLGMDQSSIQKAIFEQLQGAVKSKSISIRSGASYTETMRWLMTITGQETIEAFKISYKRHQCHARRLRIEDLYSDSELRELIFFIEKGINEVQNSKQLLALYFARIQIKSCWNTSPMVDIELSDITDVTLPTAQKSITLLLQKPRKGYDIDTYSLDGRAVNSVMRDILFVRDTITKDYRNLAAPAVQPFLFITKEKTNVSRIKSGTIVSYIKALLKRLGCRVAYNSMRIRKSGANHIYRDVAKQMRAYEAVNLHTFDTFIKHYQRISEQKSQETLHTAVDVMQRYFTGREIDSEIRVLMVDDGSTQKTPSGQCSSRGNDEEAKQYNKTHRHLQQSRSNAWCSDFLACIWCKHFRTVADPEHVWQLLSYKKYVLSDMSASISDIDNNEFQQEAINALQQRVDDILVQVAKRSQSALNKGEELLMNKGMHPFWEFAITSANSLRGINV